MRPGHAMGGSRSLACLVALVPAVAAVSPARGGPASLSAIAAEAWVGRATLAKRPVPAYPLPAHPGAVSDRR
jgi:hypothetical protein